MCYYRNAKINGLRKNAKSVTRKSVRRTRNVLRTVRRPANYAMIALLHLIYFTSCLNSQPNNKYFFLCNALSFYRFKIGRQVDLEQDQNILDKAIKQLFAVLNFVFIYPYPKIFGQVQNSFGLIESEGIR